MPNRLTRRSALFAGWLLISVAGCGPSQGNVNGTVTYQGRTVRVGTVVMIGRDNRPVNGAIAPDGAYLVQNVPVGLVSVGVISPDPASTQPLWRPPKGPVSKDAADAPAPPPSPPRVDRSKWLKLPKQYEVPAESGITTTIHPGDNTFNIELK
jgi:hypothetical protein